MKRFVLLIASVSISLLLWAVPSDACKIKVEKTVNGLGIYAASNNVYVRNGSFSDKKYYVFVTDTIVDIICDESLEINLQGGHQEGKVTCWSQKDGEPAKQDRSAKHQLAPTKRRNWLKFNSMDVSTQVDMTIVDETGNTIKINIRKCCGWIGKRMSICYHISGAKENNNNFSYQGDSLTIPPIKLNKDDKLLKFTLSENNQKMVVNKVLIDGDEMPFTVYYNKTNTSNIDDIMYDTEIVVDSLLNKELPGGHHILSYVCTVLTQKGPKDIMVFVPIDVQNEEKFLSSYYQLGLGLLGIILFVVVVFFVRKRRKPKIIANKKIERLINTKSGIVIFKADLNYHKQYENLQSVCSKLLFGQELPLGKAIEKFLASYGVVESNHQAKFVYEYIVNFDSDQKSKYLCYNIEKKVLKGQTITGSECWKIIYDVVGKKVLELSDVFVPSEVEELKSLIDNAFPNMVMNSQTLTIEYFKNGYNNKKEYNKKEYNISHNIEKFNEQFKKLCGYDESSSSIISDKSTKDGIKETKQIPQNVISNDKENQNGVPTLKETTTEESRIIMPDEEILNLLKTQFETDDKKEIIQKLKKQKELKKEVVNSIISQWNETHPENVVDRNQMNIDSLFKKISNGYIYSTGKSQLEQLLNEYKVEYDLETISATIIRELHDCIYNRGLQDGALSVQRTPNPNNNQIQAFLREKKRLVDDIANLTRDEKILQSAMDKLKQDYTILEEDNAKQVSLVEKQMKKITELESLINTQSQEHVAKLEGQISDLNNEIQVAEDTINKKNAEIIAEKKNVESITKKKAELEDRYNKVSTQLNEVEGKHQAEINKLKESHKEAHLMQKAKYEQQIADINAEITQTIEENEAKLNKQKTDYEGKLNHQQTEHELAMQQLKDKQAKDISVLNANHKVEIDKLNATIKDLGVSVNVGRDEMIKNADHLLEAISADIVLIEKSVDAVVNQSPIFVNSINNILTEILRTREEFDEAKTADWSKPDKLQAQVIQDMQDIFINALNRTGWMNNLARLLSYSRLPKLHDGFDLPAELEAHGIYTAILERIYSNMVGLLGIVNMGILVPAVLANDFDKDNYEYKNGDTWIDRFFPEVSMRNYKGKVFDIVQVGYTIDGVTEKKPVVQYN